MIIKVVYAPMKCVVEEGKACTEDEAKGIYLHSNQVFSNVTNYLVETRDTTQKLITHELSIVRGSEVTTIDLRNCTSVYIMNDDGKTIDSIVC